MWSTATNPTADSMQAEALRIRAASRNHMREAARHRRRARELMAQLEQIITRAGELGIQITITDHEDQSGGQGGNHHEGTPGRSV